MAALLLVAVFGAFVTGQAAAAGPPLAGPVWTSDVDIKAATLRGELDPNGEVTAYHFAYLTREAYEANLAAGHDGFLGASRAPAGPDASLAPAGGAQAVSQRVSGLAADTDYRLRLEATNGSDAASSVAVSFRSGALGSNVFMLDGRGWEMVSPPDKGGGEVPRPGTLFGGGLVQAAAGGSAFTFSAPGSVGADAAGSPAASQYLSRRGAGGWSTANVTSPTVGGAYGPAPEGVPFQLMSPDLTGALMLDGLCTGLIPCPRRYSLRAPGGAVAATSPTARDLYLVGTSPDLSQRVLSTCVALSGNAVEAPGSGGCDADQPNLYRWSASGLSLVNLLPSQALGTPGARLAPALGSVSADGGRIFFLHDGDLFLREGSATKQVDATVGGGGTLEVASRSGAIAYFSRDEHLYRYAAGPGSVSDLTPAGGLRGVLGASEDGEWVYYLTAAGLFLGHGSAVVAVAGDADPVNYPPLTGSARVSANGARLAFVATASLTGFDNRKRPRGSEAPGAPQSQVYLYDAGSDGLTCVSCNPYGEQPLGPSTLPGAYANGSGEWAPPPYRPRTLAAGGERVFFDSLDDLALRDKDRSPPGADPDAYEWEAPGTGSCARPGGCVGLVSYGRTLGGATFLDASADGDDAYFLTGASLVSADVGVNDVYDARVGGGFPDPEKPIACVGDACQFLPSEPWDPQPGTLVPGVGNPRAKIVAVGNRKPACGKGKVRRRGRCVRKRKRARRGGAATRKRSGRRHGGRR